jgi:selenocysteine lyase/cysteine desulfurase
MAVTPARPVTYDDAAEARHVALRGEFLLDPEVVFLNHGSFGACPRPVFERYQAWQRELELQPVEFLGRRVRDLLTEARAPLADYLGVGVDDLAYVSNVTTALNIAARSLPLRPGDEILTTDHEYGALDRTWTFVAEHTGARLVIQKLPTPMSDPDEVVEAVWAGVTPRTRVLFVSHITSPTAVTLPIEALIARAKAAGIWTVVDGAHAPSQVDINLTDLDVDFYGGNCHNAGLAETRNGCLCAPKQNCACGDCDEAPALLAAHPPLRQLFHRLAVVVLRSCAGIPLRLNRQYPLLLAPNSFKPTFST